MFAQKTYGIIILAAGNSSRLGQPKQLLQYQNKSLIRHVAEAAVSAIGSPVIIVTGSVQNQIADELQELSVHFVQNNEWQEGMASSIRIGINELSKINSQTEGVILAVSDQPFVTSELFLDLIQKAETSENSIVACSYQNTLGTPVLFPKKYFDSLLALNGAEGAKKLLKRFQNDVVSILFPLGDIDIDTQEDYRRLLSQ